jgi:predicted RND superfamily exporter protein
MTTKTNGKRRAAWILAAALIVLPPLGWAALEALGNSANDVNDWLPSRHEHTAEYRWFQSHFGDDEFVLVSWDGCTLDDPRLKSAAEALAQLSDVAAGRFLTGPVTTGRSMLDELMHPPLNLSQAAAVERLRGLLIGPDGRQTCVVVRLSPGGRRDVQSALAAVRRAVADVGVAGESVRLGGPPVANAAIDDTSFRSMWRLVTLTCAVGLFIAWLALRDLRMSLVILLTGVYCMVLSLAVVRFCGVPMNAYLAIMVPLVYVTATSGAIHLGNYFCEARARGVRDAAAEATAHARLPLGLAAATTAVGLLSICYTDLAPIRQFGFFSAVGVGLSWLVLGFVLPPALSLFCGKRAAADHDARQSAQADSGDASPSAWAACLGGAIVRRPRLTASLCVVAMLLGAGGLPRDVFNLDIMRELSADAPARQDYSWLESRIGRLMPIELIVRIDPRRCRLDMLDRARLVERLQRRIETLPAVGATIAATTFGPDLHRASGLVHDVALKRKLTANRDRLIDTGYLADAAGQEELWRISARIATLDEVDYCRMATEIRRRAEDEVAQLRHGEGVAIACTGVAPAFMNSRHSLVDGLIVALAIDVALIIVMVTLALRSVVDGLLIAAGSLFPTMVVLGAAGWLGLPLGQGAIFAPCVALGVSVDDAIHLLVCFRRGQRQGLDRRQAVEAAWRACVRPMYQSWMLLGLGMTTLAVSEFLPFGEFGLMMTAMLTAGLVGNVFLLPALLAAVPERSAVLRPRPIPPPAEQGTLIAVF